MLARFRQVLNNFPLLPVTAKILTQAIELIDTYSNSHGLLLAVALIVTTALEIALTISSLLTA